MMAGAVMFAFSYLVLVLAPNVWFVYIGRGTTILKFFYDFVWW